MPTWIIIALIVIAILVLGKLVFAFSLVSVFPITQGAMFHPSARIRVRTFLDHVPMKAGELLVDVGCGDGRVLRAASQRYGVRALGFEVNPIAYTLARIRTLGMEGVDVRLGNFWKANVADADVVFCYLFPDVMERLAGKLERELRPGTRVVSCNFPFPGWRHREVIYPESSLHADPIYIYQLPDVSIQQARNHTHTAGQPRLRNT
ncbi:MAG TPA: class I SAM-dependent methyltransferase [Syntrophales bacterium]|nr:class I SAM-dependent methyltransferase [Syntrophales bacterium]